ncbi:ArnT family glycosyltransferase [Desulfatirhabdium butyrativorans]|uniref:ArnT family glycosyltransferase n=1 Tax=Desulfatirhabdium butyrativorans TaxID=340467 RepID=UPI0004059ACF|nr:glycosyltransferase family 39 protein [Desulfatirhabdium butyrativorans]
MIESTHPSGISRQASNPRTVSDSMPLIAVLLLALALRFWLAAHTTIVNPDGTLYIHQAKSILIGQWKGLTSCGLSFVSALPFTIAAFYRLVGDWIWAGRLASILFGWAALIPLYALLRMLFDRAISRTTLLMIAVTPMMVSNSVEIVREPMMWFFATSGMAGMVRYLRAPKAVWLPLCCMLFLLAAWARVDAVVLILAGSVWLLWKARGSRFQSLLLFLLPALAASVLVLFLAFWQGISVQTLFRGSDILGKAYLPLVKYRELRTALKALHETIPDASLSFFLQEARQQVWLVALGALVNRTIEALFYPFALLYAIGVIRFRKMALPGIAIGFPVLAAISGCLLLYIHALQTWMIYYRFLGLVLLPGSVFAAIGMDTVLQWLQAKPWFQAGHNAARARQRAIIAFCAVIVLISLPKNLKTPDADKAVFVSIGTAISRLAPMDRPVRVITSAGIQPLISFYANVDRPFPVCPMNEETFYAAYPGQLDAFTRQALDSGMQFWLWEQKNWPKDYFDMEAIPSDAHFHLIGAYHHPDTGEMRLYEIR